MWNKLFSKNKSIELTTTSPVTGGGSTTHKKIKKKNKFSNVLSNLSLRKSDKNQEIIAFIETTTREINFNKNNLKRISQDYSTIKDKNVLNVIKAFPPTSPVCFSGNRYSCKFKFIYFYFHRHHRRVFSRHMA